MPIYGDLDDVTAALLDVAGPRTTIRLTAGITLLHVDPPQLSGFRLVLKGLVDRCVAATTLILLTPLMATLAAAIWLSDRGPVLFKQARAGKDGHAFRIYKFRTMVANAEPRLALPDEVARYAERVRRRLVVKPGFTRLLAGQAADRTSGTRSSEYGNFLIAALNA